jgi:diguanylate cyclase (GGDEF)-like protein
MKSFLNQGTTGRNLVGIVLLASLLITLITTSIQLWSDYRDAIDNIEQDFRFIGSSALDSLQESIWVHDNIQVNLQLVGLLRLPYMEHAVIEVDNQVKWEVGDQRSNQVIAESFPLGYRYRGKEIRLGEMKVTAGLDPLNERTWSKGLEILWVNALEIFLVAGMLLTLFHLMVSRPLSKISDYLEGLDLDREDLPQLDRVSVFAHESEDEFNQVTTVINSMTEKLSESHQELERKVIERTIQLERRNAVLSCIDRLRDNFIKESDPFLLFPAFLDHLLDLTNSEFGFVGDVLRNEDGSPYLKLYAISNLSWDDETTHLYEMQRQKAFEFRNLDNLFGQVVSTGKAVISNDLSHDPRRGGFPKGHPQLSSFLGIPVYYGTKLVGEIGLANREGGFDEDIVKFLSPVVSALGQIIVGRWDRDARFRAEEELKILATTDPLTAVDNRRKFEQALSSDLKRADRYAEDLTLIMLDIDHFKKVNDENGHDIGDVILLEVVDQVRRQIRETDLLARWGGEEFMILLPQTSLETAQVLAERIRRDVEKNSFSHELKITVSLGLTSYAREDTLETIVSRVDHALYEAKTSGRNRLASR